MPRLVVLYGSETGTAQDVAEQIKRMACARNLDDTVVCAMDDFALSSLPNCSVVLFVTSTTGDGEAPENMRNTWKQLLKRSLSPTWLNNVKFGVFGLGDSSYAKYNAVARRLQVSHRR